MPLKCGVFSTHQKNLLHSFHVNPMCQNSILSTIWSFCESWHEFGLYYTELKSYVMKKLLIVLTIFTFGSQIICSKNVFGQEVFGQDVEAVTLYPDEMEYDDLPQAVQTVLERKEFRGLIVDKVYKVGSREIDKEHHYTIRFRNGDEFEDVYLDNEGNIIDPQDEDNQTIKP